MNDENQITDSSGRAIQGRTRRRRLVNVAHPWPGFFRDPSNDPSKEYDPEHFCLNWKDCCSKNLLLKPTILSKLERDPTSTAYKKKIKWLKRILKKQNKYFIENLKSDYETKHEAEAMISRFKTYIWFTNELVKIKHF